MHVDVNKFSLRDFSSVPVDFTNLCLCFHTHNPSERGYLIKGCDCSTSPGGMNQPSLGLHTGWEASVSCWSLFSGPVILAPPRPSHCPPPSLRSSEPHSSCMSWNSGKACLSASLLSYCGLGHPLHSPLGTGKLFSPGLFCHRTPGDGHVDSSSVAMGLCVASALRVSVGAAVSRVN